MLVSMAEILKKAKEGNYGVTAVMTIVFPKYIVSVVQKELMTEKIIHSMI